MMPAEFVAEFGVKVEAGVEVADARDLQDSGSKPTSLKLARVCLLPARSKDGVQDPVWKERWLEIYPP